MRGLGRKPCANSGPPPATEARIAAKKLRYAADALARTSTASASRRFIRRLAELQDCLGRANDAYVSDPPAGGHPPARTWPLAYDAGRVSGVMSERIAHHGAVSDKVWRRMARARPFWR
jgi:triphosphatase